MKSNKQPKVWIVIADGEHARVVTPTVSEGQFHTVLTFDSASAHLRTSDMVTEGPGRVHESASTSRHSITARTDPHDQAKHKFATEVGRMINDHDHRKEFDQLVLVAPAHALHDLREALSPQAIAKVVGTASKDLVKVTDHDLAKHLTKWWLAPAA
jgi:protein required for attachment to host cells